MARRPVCGPRGRIFGKSIPPIVKRLIPTSWMRPQNLSPKRLVATSTCCPVWTSKSDIWKIDTADRQAFDPDELDAPAESVSEALSCYIDLRSEEHTSELQSL